MFQYPVAQEPSHMDNNWPYDISQQAPGKLIFHESSLTKSQLGICRSHGADTPEDVESSR